MEVACAALVATGGDLGEVQILRPLAERAYGNTTGARYQAPPDEQPMFPPGSTCCSCGCTLQPDSLAVGKDFVRWKKTTVHFANCSVAAKLAIPHARVGITKAQLEEMVPAAAHAAFCTTVKESQKSQILMRKTKASEKK